MNNVNPDLAPNLPDQEANQHPSVVDFLLSIQLPLPANIGLAELTAAIAGNPHYQAFFVDQQTQALAGQHFQQAWLHQ